MGNFYDIELPSFVATFVGNVGLGNTKGLATNDGGFYFVETTESIVNTYFVMHDDIANPTLVGTAEREASHDLTSCPSEVERCEGDECEEEPEICEDPFASYASTVVDYDQGNKKNGGPVNVERSNADDALGAPDGSTNPVSGFFSLGFGGTITVAFTDKVYDGEGDDLSFHEITNNRNSYPEETILVEVSQDGSTWYTLDTVSSIEGEVTYRDFSSTGLPWIKYVRVTDTSDLDIHNSTADGYDLDAIDAVYTCEEDDSTS